MQSSSNAGHFSPRSGKNLWRTVLAHSSCSVCVCVGVRERPLSGEAEWSRMGAGTALSPTVGAFLNDQVLEKHLCTAPFVGVCVCVRCRGGIWEKSSLKPFNPQDRSIPALCHKRKFLCFQFFFSSLEERMYCYLLYMYTLVCVSYVCGYYLRGGVL